MSEPEAPSRSSVDAVASEHELPPEIPVEGLICASCGGALRAHSGLRVVRCDYCGGSSLVVSRIGSRRLAVEPETSAREAVEASRKWLAAGWNRDRRLRRQAQLGQTLLCFLPFYRIEADCLGIALGTERRTRTVGTGKRRRTETYEVDVERTIERSFDRTYPGLNVAEWGIQRIELKGDRLVSYEPGTLDRLGMVYPPAGSESGVRAAALEELRSSADPSRGLERVRFSYLETLRARLSVIYYPLWLVRYRFLGRSYQILVDAEDGSIAYAKAPGNDLYRASVAVLAQAVVLFLATTILQLGGGSPEVLGATAIATVIAMIWGWRKFRHGGVVVEGTGVASSSLMKTSLQEALAASGSSLLGLPFGGRDRS